eukprot:ANDGO_01728.mRNA.1 hypothetical protein
MSNAGGPSSFSASGACTEHSFASASAVDNSAIHSWAGDTSENSHRSGFSSALRSIDGAGTFREHQSSEDEIAADDVHQSVRSNPRYSAYHQGPLSNLLVEDGECNWQRSPEHGEQGQSVGDGISVPNVDPSGSELLSGACPLQRTVSPLRVDNKGRKFFELVEKAQVESLRVSERLSPTDNAVLRVLAAHASPPSKLYQAKKALVDMPVLLEVWESRNARSPIKPRGPHLETASRLTRSIENKRHAKIATLGSQSLDGELDSSGASDGDTAVAGGGDGAGGGGGISDVYKKRTPKLRPRSAVYSHERTSQEISKLFGLNEQQKSLLFDKPAHVQQSGKYGSTLHPVEHGRPTVSSPSIPSNSINPSVLSNPSGVGVSGGNMNSNRLSATSPPPDFLIPIPNPIKHARPSSAPAANIDVQKDVKSSLALVPVVTSAIDIHKRPSSAVPSHSSNFVVSGSSPSAEYRGMYPGEKTSVNSTSTATTTSRSRPRSAVSGKSASFGSAPRPGSAVTSKGSAPGVAGARSAPGSRPASAVTTVRGSFEQFLSAGTSIGVKGAKPSVIFQRARPKIHTAGLFISTNAGVSSVSVTSSHHSSVDSQSHGAFFSDQNVQQQTQQQLQQQQEQGQGQGQGQQQQGQAVEEMKRNPPKNSLFEVWLIQKASSHQRMIRERNNQQQKAAQKEESQAEMARMVEERRRLEEQRLEMQRLKQEAVRQGLSKHDMQVLRRLQREESKGSLVSVDANTRTSSQADLVLLRPSHRSDSPLVVLSRIDSSDQNSAASAAQSAADDAPSFQDDYIQEVSSDGEDDDDHDFGESLESSFRVQVPRVVMRQLPSSISITPVSETQNVR